MRTNIEIDDKLMQQAMHLGGFSTKKEAVEEGLRTLVRRKAYAALLAARGTLHWDDSDQAWSQYRREQGQEEGLHVAENPPPPYIAKSSTTAQKAPKTRKKTSS